MLAIIGGTGLYNLDGLNVLKEQIVETPFGKPSIPLIYGEYKNQNIIFLARHGKNHTLLPHEINYRANIWALKSAGVSKIITISAVGSLQEEIAPGDFVIPTQFFDWVKGNRDKSFFGNGLIAHISSANLACPILNKLILDVAQPLAINMHTEKIYVGIDGPRLSTKTESHFLKNVAKCDVIGMTNIPEVFLAREAQICYCSIGVVTDYDCWYEDPEKQVNAAAVIEQYKNSLDKIQKLLYQLLKTSLPTTDCEHRQSLTDALLSPEKSLTEENKQLLALLRK
jgi:5'-methylthioadenosine phosphorylase